MERTASRKIPAPCTFGPSARGCRRRRARNRARPHPHGSAATVTGRGSRGRSAPVRRATRHSVRGHQPLSRTVANLLQREEQQALRAALAVQQQLARAVTAGDGAIELLRRLAQITQGRAAVCDQEGTVLFSDASPAVSADAVPEATRELITRLRPAGMRASHTDSGPRGGTLVQPLGAAGDRPHSYLVLTFGAALDAPARSAAATAAALLSLEGERRADALAAAREIRGAALTLLLGGQPASAQALLSLRASGAAPLDSGHQFHILRVTSPISGNDVLTALERWAGKDSTTRLAALPSGETHPVVVLAQRCDPAGPIAALGPGGQAGLGAPHPLEELGVADATARAALSRASAYRPVARWDDLVDQGLAELLGGPAVEVFAHDVLGPLANPTPEHIRLLQTLDAFHQHHGQLTAVAAELGIHRNTVHRHLRRIEQLTHRSPNTPRGRVELWVAVEVLRKARQLDPLHSP